MNPVIVPNPLNPCPNAVDLNADVSFNSCNYNIYLYDNGGDGWTTVPQTTTSIDNRIEVYIDGLLVNTITMNNGYGRSFWSLSNRSFVILFVFVEVVVVEVVAEVSTAGEAGDSTIGISPSITFSSAFSSVTTSFNTVGCCIIVRGVVCNVVGVTNACI